jgi:hypothetical protein
MLSTVEPSLSDLWRRQIGRRHRNRDPRRLGALGFLSNGAAIDDLIEVEKLVLVVVNDETAARGNITTRVAGYTGRPIPWGVCWGGVENSLFQKNLLLQPMAGARGQRMDTASEALLRLALQLDREMHRHLLYGRRLKHAQLLLPRLWAGFRRGDAAAIEPGGPELAEYCARTGRSAAEAFAAIQRSYFGLVLFPVSWVSSAWQQSAAIFADLRRFPLRQVFPITSPPEDLVGFQGAAEFDFLSTRFRRISSHPHGATTALA